MEIMRAASTRGFFDCVVSGGGIDHRGGREREEMMKFDKEKIVYSFFVLFFSHFNASFHHRR